MLNLKYFKISVEKGYATFEDMLVIFKELRSNQEDMYYPII